MNNTYLILRILLSIGIASKEHHRCESLLLFIIALIALVYY